MDMKLAPFFLKKRLQRWERRITVTKRQEFVVATLVLTGGLVLTQLAPVDWRYPMVMVLSLLTFSITALVLREELRGVEWVTLLTLPTLFTAAVALFYFLLPARWLTRLPIATLYAVGIYALLLTENIYNVAAERTIALVRAAHSVGFLLTLATVFLLLQTVFAFRFSVVANVVLVAAVTLPLTLQSLWAIELEEVVGRRPWNLTVAITIIMADLAFIFSFWPVKTTLLALFLSTCFYGLGGMAQQYVAQRLYKRTVIEFFAVVLIVFFIVILATNWRASI